MDGDILHRQPQGLRSTPGSVTDTPQDGWTPFRGGRLLVVDDSATNRLVTASLMRKAGFAVDMADGGTAAIAAVADAPLPYDAVLMDIAMPDLDGVAATRAIRALPGPRGRTPIIAVTAQEPEDRTRCLEAGMNDYVAKPARSAALLAALRPWLAPEDAVATTVRRTSSVP